MADLQVQHGMLKECIEQLKADETSRTTLVSHLREALHEQVGQLMDLHLMMIWSKWSTVLLDIFLVWLS